MDLLLIKLEKVDDMFYERLLNFMSEHGYTQKMIAKDKDEICIHDLKVISSRRQVFLHKKEIHMTNKEFDILELLARHRGQVFSKEQIYEQVWGEIYFSNSQNITAYINKIRKKIEFDPINPTYILTVWGIGYKFNEQIK